MSFYIYTETAFHHEGNKDYLLKLIDASVQSSANGVKFQVLIDLNEFMSFEHSAYTDAKSWILTIDEWREVFQYTQSCNLDIILMPLDVKAFILLKEFNIKYLEIHSASFKDEKLLNKLEEIYLPIVFGIGGRTLEEIDQVVKKNEKKDIVLMSGFQSFPSELEDIKLGRIKELSSMYPNCTIGYADHSSYDDEMAITSNEYAYILGARVFEKHIAIEEGEDRIDFQSAVSSDKINVIKTKLENLDTLLNIDENLLFDMTDKEKVYRNRQKIPVAARDIEIDEVITEEMIELKMINKDKYIEMGEAIIGKKTITKIKKDDAFLLENLIYSAPTI
jgi:N,N'-diacetyllegionaminate synthase